MPYINQDSRQVYDSCADALAERVTGIGDLNYVLTTLVLKWAERQDMSYGLLNAIIGVFECAKLEMYRRILTPYEERKRAENGDVYA